MKIIFFCICKFDNKKIFFVNNIFIAGCGKARTKHVSFSERLVQERSFRPNSSILSQRKKNQRKQKNKLKRRCSLALDDNNSTDDETRQRTNTEAVNFL